MRPAIFTTYLMVAFAVVVATVAFFVGRTAADAPGAFQRGVEAGEDRVRAQRTTAVATDSGSVAQARREGFDEGRRRGRAEGAAEGRTRGRAAVFAGFDGGWDVGSWYLINVAPKGGDLRIGSRVELRRDRWYGVCDKPGGLCRRTLPAPKP